MAEDWALCVSAQRVRIRTPGRWHETRTVSARDGIVRRRRTLEAVWNAGFDCRERAAQQGVLFSRRRDEHVLRRDHDDTSVALEVGGVEGEKLPEAVDGHGSYQPRVVGVLAADLVEYDEPLPLRKDGRCVVKDRKEGFEAGDFHLRLSGGKPEPIVANRPGSHHPKLIEVLGDKAELFPLGVQRGHGVDRKPVHRVLGLGDAAWQIGVEKGAHSPRPP